MRRAKAPAWRCCPATRRRSVRRPSSPAYRPTSRRVACRLHRAPPDDTIDVGGGLPPVNVKRVTVTYTHTYMFLPAIAGLFGNAYTTVPLTAIAEMRTEAGT